MDEANLTARQLDLDVVRLLRTDNRVLSGGTNQRRATAGNHLDAVDAQTLGDVLQSHRVAGTELSGGAAADGVALLDADGAEDVGLRAVLVLEEGDAGRAVGVVLDVLDGRGAVVLDALEVDETVETLVAAAAETGGDAAEVVASARALHAFREGLFGRATGQVGIVADRHLSPSGRRRLVLLDAHGSCITSCLGWVTADRCCLRPA